jgi:hypothetical protein
MLIWIAAIIPIVAAVWLYVQHKKAMAFWEFLLPFAASVVFILLAKALVQTVQTSDTEYWGGWAVRAEYYEPWNERVSCSHAKYDKDGKFEGYEHSYDVDYHPAFWQIVDSNGIEVRIDSGNFEALSRRWNSRQFVDLRRNYHTEDGDKYVATFPGDDALLEPITTMHRWENRVQASNSVFRYPNVDSKTQLQYKLFQYPKLNGYLQQSILGDGGPTLGGANRRLEVLNARMGRDKKLRMYILVFKNQPMQASIEQEALWQGGNKNEFVLTIGVDNDYKVQWARAISWTPVESLKVEAREFIGETFTDKDQPLDLHVVVDWMATSLGSQWQKKDFREYDYLAVEPPTWAVVLVFILTIAVNVGVCFWVIGNEYDESGTSTRYSRRFR